jgi:hypothetical protein
MFHYGVESFASAQPEPRRFSASAARVAACAPDVAGAPRKIPREIAFLTNVGVPEVLLRYAAHLARRQGVFADEALLAEGLVSEDVFYSALAQRLGAPFVEDAMESRASGDPAQARVDGFVEIASDGGGRRWLCAPQGAAIGRLLDAARSPRLRERLVVTTRARFVETVEWETLQHAAKEAPTCAERADPDICARRALSSGALPVAIVALLLMFGLLFAPSPAVALVAALPLTALFYASALLRLLACAASCKTRLVPPPIADADLPRYTIIAPLYREARVTAQLARAIDAFDYPVNNDLRSS